VVSSADADGFLEGNVRGTARLVAAAQTAGVGRLVLVSSLAAREPALSAYGDSKREGERIVEASGLDWTIVRPPAVYGPRDTELFQLFRAAKWGVVPMPPAGRNSVIHVGDLARLLLALVPGGPGVTGGVFEPDDGREGGWPHGEFARAIGRAVGRRVLFTAAARLDRLLRGAGAKLTPDRARYMLHPDWACSPDRRVPATLWSPRIPTDEGLAATAAWYRAAGWL
jgi:nucleoside-diphosphate-sugar epimerase